MHSAHPRLSLSLFLPLHYPLRLVSLNHSFGFFFSFLSKTPPEETEARIREDGSSCPEMLPASNKWNVLNHFQIESRLSKCQRGSGYMASLPVWFQQLTDPFIATAVGIYCKGGFLINYFASYLHRVITVSEVWDRFFFFFWGGVNWNVFMYESNAPQPKQLLDRFMHKCFSLKNGNQAFQMNSKNLGLLNWNYFKALVLKCIKYEWILIILCHQRHSEHYNLMLYIT